MRNVLIFAAIVLASATGCKNVKDQPGAKVEYIPVPEAYLQPCPLPVKPKDNGELSEAFVKAYSCAVQGNKDKERIKSLIPPSQ